MGEVLSLPGKILGGITGALSGDAAYDVQNVNFDRGAFDPNQQESDFTNQILARARGEMPSVAEQQMRGGLDDAARRAASFAASQRGVSPALAARLASQGQQELQSQGIGQTAMMRAQEQQRAEALGSGLLGDQRSARMAREQLGVNAALGTEGMRQRGAEAGADRQSNMLGGLGQAATMGLLLSDRRAKTGISDGRGAAREMLDKIEPSSYSYKDQSNGSGRHLSPMAQDLEKSEAGRSMVMNTPQGKMVDYGKGFGAILAAQADLNERLSQIEGREQYAFGGIVGQENAGRVAEWMGNLSGKMPSVPQSPAEMPQDGPMSTVKYNPNPEPPPQAMLGQPASVRPKMSSFRPGYSKPPPEVQPPSDFGSIFRSSAGGRAMGFSQGGLVDYPLPQFGNRYANMMQMGAIPEMLQSKSASFDGMKLGMALAGLGGDGNVAGGMGGAGGGNEIGTRSIANYETSGFMEGGYVPGRAEVNGDHPSNDKVKALLSPGEIVIPRTVVQKGPNAIKSFAASILEKEGKI